MICTRLICYLWTQGGVKLTEKDALYSTGHAHHRPIGQGKLDPREFAKITNFNQTVFVLDDRFSPVCVCLNCYLAAEASC